MSLDELVRTPPRHVGKPEPRHRCETRAFQGIPGLERAPGGRLWAAWYGGGVTEDRHNYILLAFSTDDGDSWSKPVLVVDPDGDGPVRAFDPCLWLDPDNRLWLFWSQGVEGHTIGNTLWAMRTDHPDREAPDWSAPARLGDGILMNKPLVLSTGEWLLPVAIWKQDGSAGVWQSRDRGATWQILGAATVPVPAERCCDEHMLLERTDGTLAMWVRTRYGIGQAFSRDRGQTWSAVYPSPLAHTASRFFVRRLASGNLLLVKHGPLHTRTGRSHLSAYLSADDGATWSGGLLLDERTGVSYPDGTQGPDGVIRVIYDFDRKGAKQILLARFAEEDVARGRLVSPGAALRLTVNQAHGKA